MDRLGKTTFRLHINNGDLTLFLYDGYDWAKTRKTISEEVRDIRRRLSKIRQLVASGQTQDQSLERTGALLFNSLYIGLEQDVDVLEPGALIAAIDEELKDDVEMGSQSSWQSLKSPSAGPTTARSPRVHGKRLTRSKGPSMEFRFSGIKAEVDNYEPRDPTASRTLVTVRDIEILDHIKTSTWRKFLTDLRSDSRGNIRETDSNMLRVELLSVRPVPDHPSEETRLRVSPRHCGRVDAEVTSDKNTPSAPVC
jgi:autophagy-related protein 2